MTDLSDFVILIISNGRPDDQRSLASILKCNYTGDWYIVLDNEDKTADRYIQNYGREKIIIFDKKKYFDLSDKCDNFPSRNIALPARNACPDIARSLNKKYFYVLDDDILNWSVRYKDGKKLKSQKLKNFNLYCQLMCDFLEEVGAHMVGALDQFFYRSQGIKGQICRLIFFQYFQTVDRPIKWRGRVCDDYGTMTELNKIGKLVFGVVPICLTTKEAVNNPNGMSIAYKQMGDYVRKFYGLIMCPNVYVMTFRKGKFSQITKSDIYPKILNERWKKQEAEQ